MHKLKTNLFIVGTIKGATTSIYNYLKQHSEIYFPAIKELHYFSNVVSLIDLKTKFDKNTAQHSRVINNLTHYESLYPTDITRDFKFLGDCSPTYLSDPDTPKKIFEYNPNSIIVVCIRNPIDRVLSHYYMNVNRGIEKRSLIEAVQQDFLKPDKVLFIDNKYIELGFYGEQIERYYKYFPKSQVYILKFEDLNQNTEETINGLTNFLDLHKLDKQIFKQRFNMYAKPRLKVFGMLKRIKILKKIFPKRVISFLKNILFIHTKKNNLINEQEILILKKMYKEDQEKLKRILGYKYF